MRDWPTTTIALNKGIDEGSAVNTPKLQVGSAINVDFSMEGSIGPRPAYKQFESFNQQLFTTDGSRDNSHVATRTSLQNMDALPLGMFVCRDARGEYPGMILKGSIFTRDFEWNDKGGCALVKLSKLWSSVNNIYPSNGSFGVPAQSPTAGGAAIFVPAASYDFAWTSHTQLTLYGSSGSRAITLEPLYPAGAGCGAVCRTGASAGSLMVHVPYGTNNLVLTVRLASSPDTVTQYLLATDARTPFGTGDNPCISCDYDETHCYIAYFSNANLTSVHIKRVTILTGVVTHAIAPVSASSGAPVSIWISNSSVAGNSVVYSATTTTVGDIVDILTSSTMVTTGHSLTVAHNSPLTAVGVVDTAKGYFYLVNTDANATVSVYRRSLSSTTSTRIVNFVGNGGYGVFSTAPSWYIQHQPIQINSEVYITLTKAPGWDTINIGNQACSWYTIDVGAIVDTTQVPKAGSGKFKVVARGASDGIMQPFNPVSAMTPTQTTTWRFQTVDWSGFRAGNGPLHTKISGYAGTLVMNELGQYASQYCHSGESTLLSGSVMRSIARGDALEFGFVEEYPWCDVNFPSASPGTTSIAAGDYTVCAVWRWIDEAGQLHRSAPSAFFTANNGTTNNFILFTATNLQVTEKDNVSIEVYCTDVSPTAGAPHYLQGIIPAGSSSFKIANLDLTGEVLYTDGNVLENHCPPGSGGCVTLGTRTWVSDGVATYASKLPKTGVATQWNLDDPLTVNTPASAGPVTGLASIEDKLLIICQRGIYAITGSGPDDLGAGAGFSDPVRVSELGVTNPRLIQSTPDAVIIYSAYTGTDVGGMYSIDAGLRVTHISQSIRDFVATPPTDMYWWEDRQQLIVARDSSNSLVFDARTKQWTIWTIAGSQLKYFCGAQGVLWGCEDSSQGSFGTTAVGADFVPGATNYSMSVSLYPLPTGDDPFVWGRVRGVKVLSNPTTSGAYQFSMLMIPDNTQFYSSPNYNIPASTVTTWPSGAEVEWRFPVQKMSYFTIQLTASPALPVWTALSFAHRKIGNTPTLFRG